MRRVRSGIALAVLGLALGPAAVSAEPPISQILTLECSDGHSYDINFGAPKNQGTALHVQGSNAILTSNYFKLTIDGDTVIDSSRGMQGLAGQDLLHCTGSLDFDGVIFAYTVEGWITPRT